MVAASANFSILSSGMNRITTDPDICNGQPVITGSRVTAKTILEFDSLSGDSIEDVMLSEYPTIGRRGYSCLHQASHQIS